MILIRWVVTVHQILVRKIAKAHENLHSLIWQQHISIFTPTFMRWWRLAIPFQYTPFLKVCMRGVHPTSTAITVRPNFCSAFFRLARTLFTLKILSLTVQTPFFLRQNSQVRLATTSVNSIGGNSRINVVALDAR